jgi:hypothetical protein
MKKILYNKIVRNLIRTIFIAGISMFPFILTGILYQIMGVV